MPRGAGLKASLLVTVLYGADWRDTGLDFYGFYLGPSLRSG